MSLRDRDMAVDRHARKDPWHSTPCGQRGFD
jgi:hypothetical protein